MGYIEQYGSGINEIIEECQKYGLEDPKFEEIATHFRVTIYILPKQTPSLNDNEEIIIDILRYQYFLNKNEGLSTKEISEKANQSQRGIRNHLISLINSGFIIEIAKSPTDPKKKYLLKDEYAKVPIFIQNTQIRKNLQDILNSGILSDGNILQNPFHLSGIGNNDLFSAMLMVLLLRSACLTKNPIEILLPKKATIFMILQALFL